MDMMSIVSAFMAQQAAAMQTSMAATIAKSNMNSQREVIQTLLGAAQQNMASLANVGAGIGGNVNISA